MGIVIDCVSVAKEIKDRVKNELATIGTKPTLAIVSVGEDAASQIYIRNKVKVCEEVGINYWIVSLPEDIEQQELEDTIDRLNNAPEVFGVSGILVQLPLPKHLDAKRVVNKIDPRKDVDGLTNANQGALMNGEDGIIPCTPLGVMNMIDSIGYDLTGKHVVVIGRSNLFGKPMAQLCTDRDATVTLCHSKTKREDMDLLLSVADVVIVAIGKPKQIKFDLRSVCDLVIDVGINRTEEGIVGDVDTSTLGKYTKYTPVPKGVGVLTTATLTENVLKCYKLQLTDSQE